MATVLARGFSEKKLSLWFCRRAAWSGRIKRGGVFVWSFYGKTSGEDGSVWRRSRSIELQVFLPAFVPEGFLRVYRDKFARSEFLSRLFGGFCPRWTLCSESLFQRSSSNRFFSKKSLRSTQVVDRGQCFLRPTGSCADRRKHCSHQKNFQHVHVLLSWKLFSSENSKKQQIAFFGNWCVISQSVLMQGLNWLARENLFIITFGAVVCVVFWYEAYRMWSLRPY